MNNEANRLNLLHSTRLNGGQSAKQGKTKKSLLSNAHFLGREEKFQPAHRLRVLGAMKSGWRCLLSKIVEFEKNSCKILLKVAVTRNYLSLNRLNRITSSCTSICSLPTTLMLNPWVVFHSEQTVGLSAKKEKRTKRTKTNERTERIHSWMN